MLAKPHSLIQRIKQSAAILGLTLVLSHIAPTHAYTSVSMYSGTGSSSTNNGANEGLGSGSVAGSYASSWGSSSSSSYSSYSGGSSSNYGVANGFSGMTSSYSSGGQNSNASNQGTESFYQTVTQVNNAGARTTTITSTDGSTTSVTLDSNGTLTTTISGNGTVDTSIITAENAISETGRTNEENYGVYASAKSGQYEPLTGTLQFSDDPNQLKNNIDNAIQDAYANSGRDYSGHNNYDNQNSFGIGQRNGLAQSVGTGIGTEVASFV